MISDKKGIQKVVKTVLDKNLPIVKSGVVLILHVFS